MKTPRDLIFNAMMKDDAAALQSLLQSPTDTALSEAVRLAAIVQRECAALFLCTNYPVAVLDNLCTSERNHTESMLFTCAKKKLRLIAPVLTALEPHIAQYMASDVARTKNFQCTLNACVISICNREYPYTIESEIDAANAFDADSIEAIEALVKFGAAPGECGDDPRSFTHTYDNVLESLAHRSTHFIRYMSGHINYHTCLHNGENLFHLLLKDWGFGDLPRKFVCTSLQYLIEQQHFDPAQCDYDGSENVLHRIQCAGVLSVVMPLLSVSGKLPAYLWQQN